MKSYRSVNVVIFVVLLSVVISSLLAGSVYAETAKPVHELVLHVNVDTGEITYKTILENGKPIYSDDDMKALIRKAQTRKPGWPAQGVKVGKIMKHKALGLIIYDDSGDCFIFVDYETGFLFQWNP